MKKIFLILCLGIIGFSRISLAAKEKGEEIINPEYIDEYNLDDLLLELRKEKVSKIEPIVIQYLQKLKEYRDKENESLKKNIDWVIYWNKLKFMV